MVLKTLTHASTWMNIENIMLTEINQSHTHTHKKKHQYSDSTSQIPTRVKFIETGRMLTARA